MGFLKEKLLQSWGWSFDMTVAYACVLGARESSHKETVLSSTHNLCLGEDQYMR